MGSELATTNTLLKSMVAHILGGAAEKSDCAIFLAPILRFKKFQKLGEVKVVEGSPIPAMIKSAEDHTINLEKHIQEHRQRIELLTSDIKALEKQASELQDELTRVQNFIEVLKGDSSDIKRRSTNLVNEVVNVLHEMDIVSPRDLSHRLNKDQRKIHRVVQELKTRDVLVYDHEEPVGGRYPRKFYRVNKDALEKPIEELR